MRRNILAIVIVVSFISVPAFCATYHWVDVNNGYAEFSVDEMVSDVSGDTIWTADLYTAYVTWDATHFFVAAEFLDDPWGNGLDVWLGTGDGSTCTDASGFGWSKRVGFSGWSPDYVVYSWPSTSGWEVGEIVSDASYTNYGNTDFITTYGGWVSTSSDSVAIQFPWAAMGSDGFQTGQVVQLAITVTGANWSACDTGPDQISGPFGGESNDILDTYFEIECDQDYNGVPDTGFSFSGLFVEDWEMY